MSSPVDVGGFTFQCVRLKDADFTDRAAVYVVLDVAPNGAWGVLDVGQSGQVGSCIDEHDRRQEWFAQSEYGNVWIGVHATPVARVSFDRRLAIERAIRRLFDPPCGDR